MIFSKQPQRDNIEIMLARKCGFYIRGKQQGLAEDEISMPILMTQTLHEMLVHFADEVRNITKVIYDVEIEPLRVRATQAENIALEQQAEITSLRAELEKAKKDGERYNRLRVLGCAVFGSNQLENGTVIRFQTLDEVVDLDLARHKSRGEAIDNAMKGKG